MMINLKDNSEKDKYILELFQTSPKEAFRLLFDAYHMKLCIYAVQLTDSFEMSEDIVGCMVGCVWCVGWWVCCRGSGW